MTTQPTNTDPVQVRPSELDSRGYGLLTATAQQAVLPRRLEEGVYGIRRADGDIEIVETPGYKQDRGHDWAAIHAPIPERLEASATVLDVNSFIDYLARRTVGAPDEVEEGYLFGAGLLELWADVQARAITGVLDGVQGWRHHQVTLKLTTSREFGEWLAIDGKLLPQVEFAQFVEDHLSTIGEPDAAQLLDICQTLDGHSAASWSMQNRLANGQRRFRWEETVEARAGAKGELTIPESLTLVVRIFQGSDPIAIKARFRYRPAATGMQLAVKLDEPATALETAFSAIVEDVQTSVPVSINHGRP